MFNFFNADSQQLASPGLVGFAIDTCATISSSKKVFDLAKVLSINWSTITNLPGSKFSFNEPTAETEMMSVTPNCFKASILALKLMLLGFILCPLACLGMKQISSLPNCAIKISSDGLPQEVLTFFHLVF